MIERVEEATSQLPVHEREGRAWVRKQNRRGARRRCVRRPEELQPTVRTIADLGDALRGDLRGRDALRRPAQLLVPLLIIDSSLVVVFQFRIVTLG